MAVAAGARAQTPQLFTTGTPREIAQASAIGLAHARSNADKDGIDPDDLMVADVHIDQLSMAHVRVRQSFHRIPVFGAETIVHLRPDGSVFGETDGLERELRVDTKPVLTK